MKKIIKYLLGCIVVLILLLGFYAVLVKLGIVENTLFPKTPDIAELQKKESFMSEAKHSDITSSEQQLRLQFDPNDGSDPVGQSNITSKAQFKP